MKLLLSVLLSAVIAALSHAAAASSRCVPAWQPVWPPGTVLTATGRSFARDRKGFTWVGGNLGLFRLNGQSVSTWYPEPGSTGALPGGQVDSLWVDDADGIWVGTARGLARLSADRLRFDLMPLRRNGGAEPEVYALHQHAGHLLVGTNLGLAAIQLADQALVTPVAEPGSGAPRIYGIASAGGRVYAASPTGLLVIAPTDGFRIDQTQTASLPELFKDAYLEVVEGADKQLYAGSRSGLVVFDPTNRRRPD